MSDDLVERLTNAAAWMKKLIDAPREVYSVPLTDNRMAVKRDDILMAQFRLSEAADAITVLTASLAQVTADRDSHQREAIKAMAELDLVCDELGVEHGPGNAALAAHFRVQAAEADNAKLREALQPFADRVFNDNGNLTVSGNISYDDHCRAYFTLRALTTGATK